MKIPFQLNGRRVLITAASRGIGAETAVVLAECGASVVINYHRNSSAAQEVVARCQACGVRAGAVQGDASDPAAAHRIVADAAEILGDAIDLFVANHGPFSFTPLVGLTPEAFQRIVSENVFSTQGFIHAVLPGMLAARHGTIITVGLSCAADTLDAAPNVGPYALSKAALASLTKSLAAEVAASGIRVAMVAPGLIDNQHLDPVQKDWMQRRVPAGRLGTAREVASVVAFLGSEYASYCSGSVVSVAGGWRWDQDRSTTFDTAMAQEGHGEK